MTVVQGIKTGTNVRYQNPGPGRIQRDDGGFSSNDDITVDT